MPTAVVIDGAYFLRRFKNRYPDLDPLDPNQVALGVLWLAASHIGIRNGFDPSHYVDAKRGPKAFDLSWTENSDLYRIFFYDCPPLTKRVHLPISKRALDLSRTETAIFRLKLHSEFMKVRKVALRLGRLNNNFAWRPKLESVQRWLENSTTFSPTDEDFEMDTVQKGVDMRLGLDVSSMAFKKQIDQLILVAGDADFVPAVKLARREGIDVVLDPMGGTPAKDLVTHVDGFRGLPIGFQS
jgi:uncharacterized LabA/DUF88 family protein